MKYILLITIVFVFSCNKTKDKEELKSAETDTVKLTYAKGFSISENNDLKILEIKSPFPKSEISFKYALINREKAASITLANDQYDGIILTPIRSIVVTSTTHLPALELLKVEELLVGFPGTDHISSDNIRHLVNTKQIRELGENEDINTEVLLELNPEVVIAFGIDGVSKSLETIESAKIPVIYNGDWIESSPLAKAEWLKMFGLLFERSEIADSIFNSIEADYEAAKVLALKAKKSPTVLSGAMHKDIWYLPNGTSTEAQFFKDANVNYLWSETEGQGSLSLSFETVLEKAQNAEIWFSPSYFGSLESLRLANKHYQQFKAFKEKNIFSFVNTTGETNGVIYYELGLARPDLVLKDIIKIAHPQLLPDYDTYFFNRIE